MTVFIIILAVYPVVLFFLFYFLNRGRITGLQLMWDMLYSLMIGIPLIVGSYYRWDESRQAFIPLLWIAPLFFMAPFLISKWINVFKGRESALQAVSFSIALIFFYAILFLPPFPALLSVGAGMLCIILFFYASARYPYLNSSWLKGIIEDSAKEVRHTGRYSPKPVSIKIGTGRRFITGISGLSLLAKDDHIICRINRKLHVKYGSPNLEEFFTLLCTKIKENV